MVKLTEYGLPAGVKVRTLMPGTPDEWHVVLVDGTRAGSVSEEGDNQILGYIEFSPSYEDTTDTWPDTAEGLTGVVEEMATRWREYQQVEREEREILEARKERRLSRPDVSTS